MPKDIVDDMVALLLRIRKRLRIGVTPVTAKMLIAEIEAMTQRAISEPRQDTKA